MLSTILKALVVVWPFFKALIFKDRSAMEVLSDNKQFTGMFVVLVVVALMFYVTLNELSETKVVLQAREQELSQLQKRCRAPVVPGVNSPVIEKDEEPPFDKSPVLELLDIEG